MCNGYFYFLLLSYLGVVSLAVQPLGLVWLNSALLLQALDFLLFCGLSDIFIYDFLKELQISASCAQFGLWFFPNYVHI
jgi:hypothetical protein